MEKWTKKLKQWRRKEGLSKAWLDQQHFKQKLLTRVFSCATLNSTRSGWMQAMRNVTRLIGLLGDSRLREIQDWSSLRTSRSHWWYSCPSHWSVPSALTVSWANYLSPSGPAGSLADERCGLGFAQAWGWPEGCDLQRARAAETRPPPRPCGRRWLGFSERPLPSARTAGSTRSRGGPRWCLQRPRLDHRYCHGSGSCCRRGIRVMGTRPRAKCRHTARRAYANTQWTRRTRASQWPWLAAR